MKQIFIKCLSLTVVASFLGSCVNLPDIRKAPISLYYLEVLPCPTDKVKTLRERLNWQLTIDEPGADTRFDSDYVVVNSEESKVNYIKEVRWVARLPLLVQEVFTTLFEQSNVVKGVGDPSEGLDADFILLTDIKSFQLEVREKPTIVIQVYGRLMQASDRELIAAKLFSIRIPIESETPGDVMGGFVKGVNQITGELIDWVYASGKDIRDQNS